VRPGGEAPGSLPAKRADNRVIINSLSPAAGRAKPDNRVFVGLVVVGGRVESGVVGDRVWLMVDW